MASSIWLESQSGPTLTALTPPRNGSPQRWLGKSAVGADGPAEKRPPGAEVRRTLLKRAGPDSRPLPDRLFLGSGVLTLKVHSGPH